MKFLVDAHLPYRLKTWLLTKGVDAIYTSDLPSRNLSADLEIVRIADASDRVVITKDSDFLKLHVLQQSPRSCS
jgi:predicted nuclease of predicted toxin-antitoxin system